LALNKIEHFSKVSITHPIFQPLNFKNSITIDDLAGM